LSSGAIDNAGGGGREIAILRTFDRRLLATCPDVARHPKDLVA